MLTRPQQREKGETHPPRAQEVGLQGLAHDAEIGGRRVLVGVVVNRRIVNEDVDAPVGILELLGQRVDRALLGHIEAPR